LVANALPIGRRRGLAWIAICPLLPDEQIMLLAPHHSRKCLSLDIAEIVCHGQRADVIVEVIGFFSLLLNHVVEFLFVQERAGSLRESEPDNYLC